jgi:hypothetical protein
MKPALIAAIVAAVIASTTATAATIVVTSKNRLLGEKMAGREPRP